MPKATSKAPKRHAQPSRLSGASVKRRLAQRQLERKFHDILGISPQEFLIKTRVLAACHALRRADASLSGIAANCGFYDQSSFTEHFRHHVSQTPREFRRSMAGN